MSKKHHTPAEQRGIVKNPNSPAFIADVNNRIAMGHIEGPPPAPRPPANSENE